jgi:dCMP deaminase
MSLKNWDTRFIDLAKLVSTWSKDPSTKVGAVITDVNNRVISVGYNGFPKKIQDNDRLFDRQTKYNIVVHAEANALMFASKSVKECTLYTYPFEPCPKCASLIIQSGITRVVSIPNTNERWEKDFQMSRSLFSEAGVLLEYNYE